MSNAIDLTIEPYVMRKPCKNCGHQYGYIIEKGAQDCVYCDECKVWQYNAPRVETGKKVRSTQTVHAAIKPALRAEVLLRATGRCELCGAKPDTASLHVGHLISVECGLAEGMTDDQINSLDNVCCLCDQCNLGLGKQPVPLRLAVSMVMARLKRGVQ